MCLCSIIREADTQNLSDNQELFTSVQETLSLVYRIVSSNKQLLSRLQFRLEKKSSTSSENQASSQSGKRLATLFRYDPADPNDYPTRTLVEGHFEQWTEQPSSFWGQLPQDMSYNSVDPQRLVVVAALQLAQRSAHSAILRRFYAVVLHRLRENRPRSDDPQTIARSIYDFLHPNISQPDVKDLSDLTTSVDSLVQAGSRYVLIAKELGMGSLFLLGEVIGRSVWEAWLPKDGPVFEDAMTYLIGKGIATSGRKYEKLAARLITYLEDSLPKPPCVWITDDPRTKRPKKRARQSTKPNAKRRRSKVDNRAPATPVNRSRGVLSGQCVGNAPDTLINNPNALHVLLTAAEHSDTLAGSALNHRMRSVGSPLVEVEMLSHTSIAGESTSMQSMATDALESSTTDSAVDGTGQEQLTRKDLLPPPFPNTFNAGDSWDIPGWLDIDLPPLFNAQSHFDVFGAPEGLSTFVP